MQAGSKGLDKFYAGMIGGVGVLIGWMILQALLSDFNIQEDLFILIFGLFFFIGGGYWILITFTRKLVLDSEKLTRKTALYTNYELDLQSIRGLGNLKYSTKGLSKFPYKLDSIDVILDTGNTVTLKLNGLSPKRILAILEQIGQQINPDFKFEF